jgi:2-dehydropantoate 2-reductase
VQWADAASLDVLHYLARRFAESQTPALLLLTLRMEERDMRPALVEWRTGMERAVPLTRLPLGKWRRDPDLLALFEATLRETIAVGRAAGVRLPSDSADKTLATMWSMPDYHMTSMGNDLMRGNRLELPWFAGKVVELGHRHGVPTPANAFIYTALKPYANGAPA